MNQPTHLVSRRMQPLSRWLQALTLLLAAASATASPAADPLAGIDEQIERVMTQLEIPGAAVGVVVDGKVMLARGYGLREVGHEARVSADTVFSIASMTKSFTTAVMATLVDEGKLDWDTPVRQYLPGFEMYDPTVTQQLTPRDLLTHRTGMPRHDFLRFSTYLQPAELVARLRYLPPNRPFRDGYQYSNIMYATAGYLAGEVAGSTWNEAVRVRLFQPLGMLGSTTSVSESLQQPDHARPHLRAQGKVTTIPFYDHMKFGVAPGGAIGSSANDLLKYLQMYLNEGRAGGRQIISAAQLRQLHKPVTIDGSSNYALGWGVRQRHGEQIIQHGGSINGFTSFMAMVPQRKIGVVVLNNLQGSALPSVLTEYLVARLVSGADAGALQVAPEREWPPETPPARVAGTRTTLALDAYAGEYFHPAYGAIRVERRGAALTLKFDAFELPLKHHHYDTFFSEGRDYLGTGLYQFQMNTAGQIAQLSVPLEPAVAPFVFVRREKVQ